MTDITISFSPCFPSVPLPTPLPPLLPSPIPPSSALMLGSCTWTAGAPPKKEQIRSTSRVADITISFSGGRFDTAGGPATADGANTAGGPAAAPPCSAPPAVSGPGAAPPPPPVFRARAACAAFKMASAMSDWRERSWASSIIRTE